MWQMLSSTVAWGYGQTVCVPETAPLPSHCFPDGPLKSQLKAHSGISEVNTHPSYIFLMTGSVINFLIVDAVLSKWECDHFIEKTIWGGIELYKWANGQ